MCLSLGLIKRGEEVLSKLSWSGVGDEERDLSDITA